MGFSLDIHIHEGFHWIFIGFSWNIHYFPGTFMGFYMGYSWGTSGTVLGCWVDIGPPPISSSYPIDPKMVFLGDIGYRYGMKGM